MPVGWQAGVEGRAKIASARHPSCSARHGGAAHECDYASPPPLSIQLQLLGMMGLQNLMLPVPFPGARRLFLPLAPPLSDDDRRTVENVAKVGLRSCACMPVQGQQCA